jgi:hypothetical protein
MSPQKSLKVLFGKETAQTLQVLPSLRVMRIMQSAWDGGQFAGAFARQIPNNT